VIAIGIEVTQLRRQIAAQHAGTHDEQQQRHQKGALERHAEVTRGHQQRTDDHGASPTKHPVTQYSAEHRHQIDEPDIQAEDLRGERLRGQWAGHALDDSAETAEAGNVFNLPGQQQVFDHVENQQRLHAVEGNALPQLGAADKEQSTGMTQQFSPAWYGRVRLRRAGIERH
jgi:hypothetical protein